ncbi:MAG: nucleotidyl transferase AbiEii/AbiGii toxin family protein [Bacilli bacterium]
MSILVFFNNESILRVIRLEIGALSAWSPTQKASIEPYVAEYYPMLFEKKETEIITTTAERTFWEKATILHQEALRPKDSIIPARYSRHYYDMYCLAKSQVKELALSQPDLLIQVAEFKQKFYPRGWAKYELAKVGSLKLYPAEHSIQELKKDYAKMRKMIYGHYPSFDDILDTIMKLEKEINSLLISI